MRHPKEWDAKDKYVIFDHFKSLLSKEGFCVDFGVPPICLSIHSTQTNSDQEPFCLYPFMTLCVRGISQAI